MKPHVAATLLFHSVVTWLLLSLFVTAEHSDELQSFVVPLDAQPDLHWAVELDCDSAVNLPNLNRETGAANEIHIDDGICRALCSQFKEKDMSKKALAEAFAAHNALSCRYAYQDALFVPAHLCLGEEGNYIFTITKPSNLRRLMIVSQRIEIYWKMKLDIESERGCVNGSTFLYNFIQQIDHNDDGDKKDKKANIQSNAKRDTDVLPAIEENQDAFCLKDWSGSIFDTGKYPNPGILNRIGELNFLSVNITKASSVDLQTMKVPFTIQLNNRDCFGTVDRPHPEGGLIIFFDRYLSDLEMWL